MEIQIHKLAIGFLLAIAIVIFAALRFVDSTPTELRAKQVPANSKKTGTVSGLQKATVEFQRPEKVALIASPKINESSGLAASRQYPGCFWTHNDNGRIPGLFLIDLDGRLRASAQLKDAPFRDWEDISSARINGKNFLVLADVGDNYRTRDTYRLFIVEEPELLLESAREPVETIIQNFVRIEFSYPEGSRDCEALAIDASQKQIWLISKAPLLASGSAKRQPATIHYIPWPTNGSGKTTAKHVADYPDVMVTAMDFSADNRMAVVRTYLTARIFVRRENEEWREALARDADAITMMPLQRQGESICFDLQGQNLFLTSESTFQPIWKIGLRNLSSGR